MKEYIFKKDIKLLYSWYVDRADIGTGGRELFHYHWDWDPGLCIVEAGDLGDQVELAKKGSFYGT